ncbi:hypothetical protein AAFG13_06585 [Bradyrhizobium sp. B124]|uniref:hypothetical protein n=1 Tax=Bradyrhizobium sp. B124 TaxID=3140245 RepID=UPI0031832275
MLARRFRGGGGSAPAPDTFGAGATPFSFAGPGSMNVDPSTLSAPPPAVAAAVAPPVAAPAPAAAAPLTDASSVNRPGRAPDDYIPVGNYQMPAFRNGAPAPLAAEDDEESTPPAPATRAPVSAAPGAPASAPFSLAGAGVGDRFGKATRGFLGNLGNGPIGALAGGLGALITGQNTDPSSIAAEQNSLTAQALLKKGASAAEVQAARYNPTLQKALIDQYYGKDKWSVVKTGKDADGNEIYMQQNQLDGTLRPIPAAAAPAGAGSPGTVMGPDGKPIAIPPGVDRKTFVKRVSEANADAATGKATEAQAKASSFAARMQQSEAILGGLQNQGLSAGQKIAGEIPFAGNYLQSTDYQKYKTAASAFITAMLRQESGAAINKSEFDRYEKEMFPQPGDAPAVVQQKAQMRAAAIQQMQRAAGPGYKPPSAAAPAASGKTSSGVSWSVN